MSRHYLMNTTAWQLCGSLVLGGLLVLPFHSTSRADIASVPTEMGSLGGGQSEAWGVTNDGVVVGDATLTGDITYVNYHAFRWTPTSGMTDLGTLGGTTSQAESIAANGTVVAGFSEIASDSAAHAFRWTQAGGMADLGTLGGTNSYAYGISADGSVIVGQADLASGINSDAFRWTQAGGMADLGTLGGASSIAYGVSSDGSTVVGSGYLNGGAAYHAFRWTQAGGMADLGTLGGTNSFANAASSDGSVVVGQADLTGNVGSDAFRWTQSGGLADLGTLGGSYSQANSVSADGSVVVGQSYIGGDAVYHAFRWTQVSGMADFNTLLSNSGVSMTGVTLNYAYGISPNGKYIVGAGTFADSAVEAYIACYDPSSGCIGVTTGAAQQAATQDLSAHQRAALIESRSTASELLGLTRPVDNGNKAYAGGMFGSAVGYTGGQYAAHGVTVLGGIAYGRQDYANISQSNAPTVAAAARYVFNVAVGNGRTFHPFVEVGSWVTPQTTLSLSRPYANGSGTATGQADTNATEWAEYGRAGVVWHVSSNDQLVGFGEGGQQYMAFAPYTETNSGNPFPASVSGGVLRLDVARVGGSWTHWLDGGVLGKPSSFTLAVAAARAFNEHAGLTATVAGVGTSAAVNQDDTWGEFGGRFESELMKNIALDLDLTGTTGSGVLGTALHGGAGITYRF